jgi:DNA-binding NtrC family response regulator
MVDRATTGAEGIDRLATVDYDVAIVAAPVPDFANEFTLDDLLERLLALRRSVPVVVYDHRARLSDAVRYMQIGAFDVVGSEDDAVVKIETAAGAWRSRPPEAVNEPWREMLVGTSPAMRRTADVIWPARAGGSRWSP